MSIYITKNPSTKGPGMVLPNCNDHVAIKKFLKQLHFEVNTLLGSQVEPAKTVTEKVATLINLAEDMKKSYAEFEKAKANKKSKEKWVKHAIRRQHVTTRERADAIAEKTITNTAYETQLAKMYSLVIDYVDCRSQLQFAIDGEVNYQVPDTIPAINIEELFAPEAPAKVA